MDSFWKKKAVLEEKIKSFYNENVCGIPLGGLGTGTIELRSDGRLWDWQIFNNPPWSGKFLSFSDESKVVEPWESLIAVRVKEENKPPIVRLLQRMKTEDVMDMYYYPDVRTIKNILYVGEYPFANLYYEEENAVFPVEISLEAFSPFIPLDSKNSSLPCAIFTFTIKNLTSNPVSSSIIFSIPNPCGYEELKKKHINEKIELKGKIGIKFSAEKVPSEHSTFNGNMTLACTSSPELVSYLSNREYVAMKAYSGFWPQFKEEGSLPNKEKIKSGDNMLGTLLENLEDILTDISRVGSLYKIFPPGLRTNVESVLFPDIALKLKELEKKDLRYNLDGKLRWGALLEFLLEKDPEAKSKFNELIKEDPSILDKIENKVKALEKSIKLPTDLLNKLTKSQYTKGAQGMLCAKVNLKPFEEQKASFVFSWYFPNHIPLGYTTIMGHMYENWFKDSTQVASYVIDNLESLTTCSKRFKEALYDSTFEYWLADSINAQLSTFVKSSFYDKKGRFAIWEGLGCCGLQTVDVTYYGSFPVVLFFPELEISQLLLTAQFQLTEKSDQYYRYFMAFKENEKLFKQAIKEDEAVLKEPEKRLTVMKKIMLQTGKDPMGRIPHFFPGNFEEVDQYHMIELNPNFTLLVYRDYLYLGDKSFLAKFWPHVKSCTDQMLRIHVIDEKLGIPYMFSKKETNDYIACQTYDGWDFYGYSIYINTIWIASLIATIKMAEISGDTNYAEKIKKVLSNAQKSTEDLLWNGEYYMLWKNPHAKPNEKKEDNFVHADGLNGQWYANLLDFGYILDKDRVRRMLQAINHYCRQPEKGLLNGFYPEKHLDKIKKVDRNMQSDSPWTGTEYCVASLFIQEDMVNEGLSVVKDVYNRYLRTGMLWNHIECGTHYYRAMDVWCVLMDLEGFHYNAIQDLLKFNPKINPSNFKSVYANSKSWGTLEQRLTDFGQDVSIKVVEGNLELRKIELRPAFSEQAIDSIEIVLNKEKITHNYRVNGEKLLITLDFQHAVKSKEELSVKIKKK